MKVSCKRHGRLRRKEPVLQAPVWSPRLIPPSLEMSNLIQFACLFLALGGALAFPDGAPFYACGPLINMRPVHSESHPLDAKDSDYRLVQDKAAFQPNDVVTVQLSTKGLTFKGFIVKAVDQHGSETGHFLPGDLYQPMTECSGATHVNREDKRLVMMRWQAPSNTSGEVRFLASVVHKYTQIYTGLKSVVAPTPVAPEVSLG
ncbi:putative defense protein 3 [Haemaphysalis longicornis]